MGGTNRLLSSCVLNGLCSLWKEKIGFLLYTFETQHGFRWLTGRMNWLLSFWTPHCLWGLWEGKIGYVLSFSHHQHGFYWFQGGADWLLSSGAPHDLCRLWERQTGFSLPGSCIACMAYGKSKLASCCTPHRHWIASSNSQEEWTALSLHGLCSL